MEISAFFNPFNVAIKTGKTDEGHKISFLYPKKSYDVSLNVKSETINEHKLDLASLLSTFTRFLPKPGQGFSFPFPHPFKSSATTTTTTESIDTFDDDSDSPDGSSWSSSDDSSSSTADDKPSSGDTEEESPVDSTDDDTFSSDDTSSNGSSGSDFSVEAAEMSYIPPDTVNDFFDSTTRRSAAPVKINVNYLPPK